VSLSEDINKAQRFVVIGWRYTLLLDHPKGFQLSMIFDFEKLVVVMTHDSQWGIADHPPTAHPTPAPSPEPLGDQTLK
jgi:hypothetical protein